MMTLKYEVPALVLAGPKASGKTTLTNILIDTVLATRPNQTHWLWDAGRELDLSHHWLSETVLGAEKGSLGLGRLRNLVSANPLASGDALDAELLECWEDLRPGLEVLPIGSQVDWAIVERKAVGYALGRSLAKLKGLIVCDGLHQPLIEALSTLAFSVVWVITPEDLTDHHWLTPIDHPGLVQQALLLNKVETLTDNQQEGLETLLEQGFSLVGRLPTFKDNRTEELEKRCSSWLARLNWGGACPVH